MDVEPLIRVANVVVDGVRREMQLLGNLLDGVAGGPEPERRQLGR